MNIKTLPALVGIFLLLLSGLAIAFTPHPVYGVVTFGDYQHEGVSMTLTNLDHSYSRTVTTNSNGNYQFELANWAVPFSEGYTRMRLTIDHCKDFSFCNKEFTLSTSGADRIDFTIVSDDQEIVPDATVQCWDGSMVYNTNECPAVPIVQPVPEPYPVVEYVCDDGTTVSDSSECPETSKTGWLWGIIGMLAALFGLGGWKIYNGIFKHFHRGIKSYHDPSTRHTNLKYRHRLWKINPFHCIKDVNKIQNGIDLTE